MKRAATQFNCPAAQGESARVLCAVNVITRRKLDTPALRNGEAPPETVESSGALAAIRTAKFRRTFSW